MNLKKKAYCFLFPEFDISFQDGAVKVCVHLGLLEATLLYTLKGTSAADSCKRLAQMGNPDLSLFCGSHLAVIFKTSIKNNSCLSSKDAGLWLSRIGTLPKGLRASKDVVCLGAALLRPLQKEILLLCRSTFSVFLEQFVCVFVFCRRASNNHVSIIAILIKCLAIFQYIYSCHHGSHQQVLPSEEASL